MKCSSMSLVVSLAYITSKYYCLIIMLQQFLLVSLYINFHLLCGVKS